MFSRCCRIIKQSIIQPYIFCDALDFNIVKCIVWTVQVTGRHRVHSLKWNLINKPFINKPSWMETNIFSWKCLLFLFSLVLHVVSQCFFEATPHTVSLVIFFRAGLEYKQKEKMPVTNVTEKTWTSVQKHCFWLRAMQLLRTRRVIIKVPTSVHLKYMY